MAMAAKRGDARRGNRDAPLVSFYLGGNSDDHVSSVANESKVAVSSRTSIFTSKLWNHVERCSQESLSFPRQIGRRAKLDKRNDAALDDSWWSSCLLDARVRRRGPKSLGGVMEIPKGLKYSKEHEWVATEDTVATVGITDHAQEQLGEIVYIELPSVGDKISKDDPFGVVESVKAVSDIYAPVSGTVIEVNEDLPESPEVVNEDPYGDGWLVKVQMNDDTDLEDLMDNNEYEEMIAREKE
jgi:glycine cleavage system H protein